MATEIAAGTARAERGNKVVNIIDGYETWSELELLAGVVIGEARGESTAGMIGVAMTVKTRVSNPCWWGRNWREVILRRKQFSCWDDVNAAVIRESREKKNQMWKMCFGVAIDAYIGNVVDSIGGPTHYHAASIYPDWASGMRRLARVGNHIFYRDISQVGDISNG